MAMYRLLGAAAALALISAPAMTPALAQQVISEPGYCAFFYPNANCQNKGPGNPYTDPNYQYSASSARAMWCRTAVRRSASYEGQRADPRHACSDGCAGFPGRTRK